MRGFEVFDDFLSENVGIGKFVILPCDSRKMKRAN